MAGSHKWGRGVHYFNLQELPNSKHGNEKDLKVKSFLEHSHTWDNQLIRFSSYVLSSNTIKLQPPVTSQNNIKDICIEFP